jgi:hypothetical protein
VALINKRDFLNILKMFLGYVAFVLVAAISARYLLVVFLSFGSNLELGEYKGSVLLQLIEFFSIGFLITFVFAFLGWLITVLSSNHKSAFLFGIAGFLTTLLAHFLASLMFSDAFLFMLPFSLVAGACGGYTYWYIITFFERKTNLETAT